MNRLKHQASAYWRSLQISEAKVIFFVEGGLDRPYYERFIEKSCSSASLKYKICAIKEIGGYQGGKAGLGALHDDLLQENKLSSTHFGKKMAVAFFADKDVDDICGFLKNSVHFIYTPTYDVEGMLVQFGNFPQAIADSGGLTRSQVQSVFGNTNDWLEKYVENWVDYITLCTISHKHSINIGVTFGSLSNINGDNHQPVVQEQLNHWQEKIKNLTPISDEDFLELYRSISQKITQSINEEMPMRYFKGKWVSSLIQTHLKNNLTLADASLNSIGEKIITALLASVSANDECPHFFNYKTSIYKMIEMVKE